MAMANLLTCARIGLIIPFAVFFVLDNTWAMHAALALFIISALTDFLDGRIARARNEITALGAALDPLADKLLVTTALILLLWNATITGVQTIAVLVIILREIMVSGLREAVATKRGVLAVISLAKWKTMLQIIAVGLFLSAASWTSLSAFLTPAAGYILWLAAGLTVWTGALYTVMAVRFLSDNNQTD